MNELVKISVRSQKGESQDDFSARLSRFWTHMLRQHQLDFEKVYAESTEFEEDAGRQVRHYVCQPDGAEFVAGKLQEHGFDHAPLDLDDTYSTYETVPPEWMWIEH